MMSLAKVIIIKQLLENTIIEESVLFYKFILFVVTPQSETKSKRILVSVLYLTHYNTKILHISRQK